MFLENINVLEFVGKYYLIIKFGIFLKDKDMVFIDVLLKEFGDGLVFIDGVGIFFEVIVFFDVLLKRFGDSLVFILENFFFFDGDDLIVRVLG